MAVGLARLEVPATLISQVGHDERGGLVVQHVTSSGAEIVAVPTSTGRTSVATARLDETGAASYDFDLEWSLPRQELPPCRALHVGSLGTLLEPGRESVLDLVEQAGAREVFVSYDANLRESFIDDRDARPARRARPRRAVHAGQAERRGRRAARSRRRPRRRRPHAAAAATAPSSSCSPAAPSGATAFTAEGEISASGRARSRWSTPSAPGDAFMAATLAQLSDLDAFRRPGPGVPVGRRGHWRRLLRGAMEVAAITCERRGANPPRRQELPPGWPA